MTLEPERSFLARELDPHGSYLPLLWILTCAIYMAFISIEKYEKSKETKGKNPKC
jgi:hypothetical protein